MFNLLIALVIAHGGHPLHQWEHAPAHHKPPVQSTQTVRCFSMRMTPTGPQAICH